MLIAAMLECMVLPVSAWLSQRLHSLTSPFWNCYISQMTKSEAPISRHTHTSTPTLACSNVLLASVWQVLVDTPLWFLLCCRYGVYVPLFVPLSVPIVMSLVRAFKWIKSRNSSADPQTYE